MFERFTEPARQVVVLAQEEARTLRHDYIGTEHLLLGMLREEAGVAAQSLARLNVTLEGVRAMVIDIVGSGEEVSSGQIPFTPRAKKVLELALHEALSIGDEYIGTEHLLLGLAGEDEGVATGILLDLGADREKIRSEALLALSGPGAKNRVRTYVPDAADGPKPALHWHRARMLWRPEGLELRIPVRLGEGAIAAFAGDDAWTSPPLAGLRREIWEGWVTLASPTLLEDTDPVELRRALEGAAKRALDASGREHGRVEDFLRRLRDGE